MKLPFLCRLALFSALGGIVSAQEIAPERVSNMIWEFASFDPGHFPARAIMFSNDGFVYERKIDGSFLTVVRAGPYEWRKTGPNSGTTGSGTSVVFRTPTTGTYTNRLESGSLRLVPFPVKSDPPLRNLSARVTLAPGQLSTVGFVVAGAMPRRVVVRAVGPALAQFGVTSPATNPTLTVFQGSRQIAANSGWGGGAEVAMVFSQVGAFALPPTSRDSALVLTLAAGGYSAQVASVGGGEVLLEVYFID